MAYLLSAENTISNDTFRYRQELDCGKHAVLKFEPEMAGIHVNGVDILEWYSNGKIIKFKVMLWPLKAAQIIHSQRGTMLETMK